MEVFAGRREEDFDVGTETEAVTAAEAIVASFGFVALISGENREKWR